MHFYKYKHVFKILSQVVRIVFLNMSLIIFYALCGHLTYKYLNEENVHVLLACALKFDSLVL
jgi:hypothetical protein